MDDEENRLIGITEAAKLTGIPARTLRYAARTGNLWSKAENTPRGLVYLTTIKEVERFRGTYTPKPRVKK